MLCSCLLDSVMLCSCLVGRGDAVMMWDRHRLCMKGPGRGRLQLCMIAFCRGKSVGVPVRACEQCCAAGQPAAVCPLCTTLGLFLLCASSAPFPGLLQL